MSGKIVIEVMGGLGNQLFQYSFGRAVSEKLGCALHLDTKFFKNYFRQYLLDEYKIIAANGVPPTSQRYCECRTFEFDPCVFSVCPDTTFFGYWQNKNYFCSITDKLLQELKPKKVIKSPYMTTIEESESVSVHFRRGDYLSIPDMQGICDEKYYERAIEYLRRNVSNPLFVLFSDDLEWLRSKKIVDSVVCPSQNAVESLFMMSLCKHNIVCNSSFSWWGAFLNRNTKKIVVSPKIWHNCFTDFSGIISDTWVKV